jgi:hypothetical protein
MSFGIIFGNIIQVDDKIKCGNTFVVTGNGTGKELSFMVCWYDRGLSRDVFDERIPISLNEQLTIDYRCIRTSLWNHCKKHVLMYFGMWSQCSNCFGPKVIAVPYIRDYTCPDNMRFSKKVEEINGLFKYTVNFIPDESKFPERVFKCDNMDVLIDSCSELFKLADEYSLEGTKTPSIITEINPVRVQLIDNVVILWMGGKKGVGISPNEGKFPAVNGLMVTSTDNARIFNLEKMFE